MSNLGKPWRDAELVVVDIEGNGQRPHDVVEVAVARIRQGRVISEVESWLVEPPRPITRHVRRIHGISNADVAGCPPLQEVRDEVLAALGDGPVIGHHVIVDYTVLGRELRDWSPQVLLDTVWLARRLLPGRRSYSLASLVEDLELGRHVPGRPHRAAYDAVAAGRLFLRLLEDRRGDVVSLADVARLCQVVSTDAVHDAQHALF